jgi:hypothetical protein
MNASIFTEEQEAELRKKRKQVHVTVTVLPAVNKEWARYARMAKISKGEVLTKLLEAVAAYHAGYRRKS